MVTITNGRTTLKVTSGAYKDIYAPQGFHEVIPSVSTQTEITSEDVIPAVDTVPEVKDKPLSEDTSGQENENAELPQEFSELSLEELGEIPLGEMSSEQLRRYAKLLGVDLRGMNSKKAVINKIRSAL